MSDRFAMLDLYERRGWHEVPTMITDFVVARLGYLPELPHVLRYGPSDGRTSVAWLEMVWRCLEIPPGQNDATARFLRDFSVGEIERLAGKARRERERAA